MSNRLVLKLGGSLAEIAGASRLEWDLAGQPTLAEVAQAVGVSPKLVMLYSVNGALKHSDYQPEPGDEVLLIPAVAGGSN